MRVSEIIKLLSNDVQHIGGDPDIQAVVLNSRQVRPGYIFAAIPGSISDGADYVEDALSRGAVAVVSEKKTGCCDCQIVVKNVHLAFAQIAAAINNNPSQDLSVVGVTGTNGKTTTAYMIRDVLRNSGGETGLIGTVAYEIGSRIISASRTTPDAATVQSLLKQMIKAGCESAVMEVSSHALIQHRASAVDFDVGVFTNLTHEHLDYHKTMNAYFEAKALLFRSLKPTATAVINRDDEWGIKLMGEKLQCKQLSYSVNGHADVAAENVGVDINGCRFTAKTPWGTNDIKLQLLGRHNISNALACIASCGVLGVELAKVADGLEHISNVRGRLEPLVCGQEFGVFVDYAHTGDALEHALETIREITEGRLILVFGCGGDRDKEKRYIMGKTASILADVVVITSDNPRTEYPELIIKNIVDGIDKSLVKLEVVEDREKAIHCALEIANPKDTVLIAGKGHETYQERNGVMSPFDDMEVAREFLENR